MRSGKQPAGIWVSGGKIAYEGKIRAGGAAKVDGGTEEEEARGQTVPPLRAASCLGRDFGILGD